MIFDNTVLLSDKQEITASAPSENVIDLGAMGTPQFATSPLARDLGKGQCVPLLVQVTEAFAGATSVQVAVTVSETADFATKEQVLLSAAVPVAKLVPGYQFNFSFIPKGVNARYLRLDYILVGNATAGAVMAGVTMGDQTNG